MGVSFADICLYGRWSSEKSAREYIRRGEAELVKARPEYAAVIKRCMAWNSLGPLPFLSSQKPAAVAQIERKRVTPELILRLEACLCAPKDRE